MGLVKIRNSLKDKGISNDNLKSLWRRPCVGKTCPSGWEEHELNGLELISKLGGGRISISKKSWGGKGAYQILEDL